MLKVNEIQISTIEQLENTRDTGDVDELMRSIQQHGLLEPIGVRKTETGFECVYGNRRLAAARKLGWKTISAVIKDSDADDTVTINLVENLHRKDPTLAEFSRMFGKLAEQGLSLNDISARLNLPSYRVRAISEAMAELPTELLDNVRFKKTAHDPGVGVSALNQLLHVKRRHNLNAADVKKLTKKVVGGKLADAKIGLVGTIMSASQVSVDEAIGMAEECTVKSLTIIIGNNDLKKLEKAYGQPLIEILYHHIAKDFPVVTPGGKVSKGFRTSR